MDSSPNSMASRRRTFELPKSSPDAGLAEWTSRIKAIQQEVDQDEEAEQRRLQEEIERSRVERAKRRSALTVSADLSKKPSLPSEAPSSPLQFSEEPKDYRSDALKKLVGSDTPPDQSRGAAPKPSASSAAPKSGISLAEFMGGKATGPRLNKVTTQTDTYDPTLYNQNRPAGPHPVFGQPGGVRKVSSRSTLPEPSRVKPPAEENRTTARISPSPADNPKPARAPSPIGIPKKQNISPKVAGVVLPFSKESKEDNIPVQTKPTPTLPPKPAAMRRNSEQKENSLPSPITKDVFGAISKPSFTKDDKEPISVPSKTPPSFPPKPAAMRQNSDTKVSTESIRPSPSPKDKVEISRSPPPIVSPKPTSLAEMIGGRATGPRLNKPPTSETLEPTTSYSQGRALPGLASSTYPPPSTILPALSAAPKPNAFRSASLGVTAMDSAPSKSLAASPPPRPASASNVVTLSLARPVQPNAAAPPSIIAVASPNPSPAFLRPTPSAQELHPSLTRLQGRGLVNQRVKAASQLFRDGNPPASKEKEGGSSPVTPSKRPAVLDRWQPQGVISPSPIPSPSASLGSKTTVYRELPGLGASRGSNPPSFGRKNFEEEENKAVAPVRLPGLASPTSKLFKDPYLPQAQVRRQSQDDEPVQQDSKPKGMNTAPLSHPTRDRARKPKRGPSSSTRKDHSATEETVKVPTLIQPVEVPVSLLPPTISIQTPEELNMESPKQESPATPPSKTSPAPIEETIQALKEDLSYPFPRAEPAAPVAQAGEPNPSSSSKYAQLGGFKRPSTLETESIATPQSTTPGSPERTKHSPDEAPLTPRSRIPSTGHRATVMDVAQALLEHEQHIRESSYTPEPLESETPPKEEVEVEEEVPRLDVRSMVAGWGRNIVPQAAPPERRRSSYESRFSVATLPPLVEVKTPAETPQTSLSRGYAQSEPSLPNVRDVHTALKDWNSRTNEAILEEGVEEKEVEQDSEDEREPEPEALPQLDTIVVVQEIDSPPELEPQPEPEPIVEKVEAVIDGPASLPQEISEVTQGQPSSAPVDELVTLSYQDAIPPAFNLQAILRETFFIPDPNCQTISVEILSISGSIATTITTEPNVFYDSEIIAVIHRSKEKTAELVSNKVWVWIGQNAQFGLKEERKTNELAERYGTTATHCSHGSEPPQFIHTLGGVLAIRQGHRAHWSSENTAMHRILRVGDSMFVDEVELGIANLCSAYSYCLSILGSVYVWHGRGSTEDERKVAVTYGQSLTATPSNVTEFEEGNEDEMFWMMLGNDEYANADLWKYKDQLDRVGTRLFSVDSTKRKTPVQLLPGSSALEMSDGGVFVIDCRLEIFVLVTAAARGRRGDIQLALFLAQNISAGGAHKRPFNPPIHFVILPSKIPLELKAAIRMCDEAKLNNGVIPDHMNLVTINEAFEQMQRREWPRSQLSDHSFLPLGVDPSML